MSQKLQYQYGHQTIMSLMQLQENDSLNLEPGFQRNSVWRLSDRRKLIQSILEGYPMPSIFLYRREEEGWPIYDVIDGKQRLETIFMYAGIKPFRRKSFDVRFQFPADDQSYAWTWKELEKWHLTGPFLSYRIQTVEVSGDLADIVDLFVRINSTGKALVSSEKRNAKFYKSPFLKEAKRLAGKHRRFFRENDILRESQIDRMKDVELVSELLASLANGAPIDRKSAVDQAVGSESLHGATLSKASREVNAVIAIIKRLFPDLRSTRFRNSSEFYSLFMVIWELRQEKLILTGSNRTRPANELLKQFSNGVDRVREAQRTAGGARRAQSVYSNYLLSVQQSTDKLSQRTQRARILRGVFGGLFEKKDERRAFTQEQRRILWNNSQSQSCYSCGDELDWTNFEVDHLKAHSRGGKTRLKNADLICKSCNTSKGAGRRPRKRQVARRTQRSTGPRRPDGRLMAVRKVK